MEQIKNVRIISFNCAGAINKLPIIRDLCEDGDIILLQETWITPININIFDNLHPEFFAKSISSVRMDCPLAGRPHGGLSILWRRSLSDKIDIKSYDDPGFWAPLCSPSKGSCLY